MKLHILQLPKLLLERRSSALFGMVIIAMLWAGVALKHAEDLQADKREAERINQNFALVFEENVLRSIGEIDKSLLYLRRSIETRKDADLGAIANTTDVLSEIIVQVAIIDAKGIMRASSAGPQPAPPLDLSDRDHFKVHVESTDDLLYISKPVVGRASGKWSVQFSRRFLNSKGTFGGVVVASLNPEHFTNFYDRIDLGSSASISLIGSDGVVRSSGGTAGGFALGQDHRGTDLFAQMRAGFNATTFEAVDAFSGLVRLVHLRRVRGHPLWVSVSVDINDIYAGSRATFQFNALVAALLTIIILLATERILRTEARARQKAEQLQLTLESMSQGIMLVTKDLEIPIINSRCGELLDLPSEFIKNPPRFNKLLEYQAQNSKLRDAPLWLAQDSPKQDAVHDTAGQITVCERSMPDGTVIEVRSGHLTDGGLVQTFTDVTKRCEAEAHVARLASEDPLTGLPNRRVFRSALEQVCGGRYSSRRDASSDQEFGVMFLDIDRFKVVNDTLGHRLGDLLLQEVAKRLKSVLPETDLLSRLGGDEFAVLLPSVQSRAALEALANRLIGQVLQPYDIDGYRIRSGISIGIAVGPADGVNADDLIMAADLALYAVKGATRGTYKFYQQSMNQELNDRRQIETDLREAIERNELELHYQPIMNLRRNVVTGFEALARWRHPVRGMVPPVVFIPIAEDSGLILPLGEWVLREACCKAAQWPDHVKIAVNLSPIQFLAPNLFDLVQNVLVDSGLPPSRLELEITERIFMDNNENTLTTLRRLKQLGVRISMDDFGTGYSSLSYLRSFPFDNIKVDRSFVSDLGKGTEHAIIVQAVVSMSHALGMTTTAEGVETAGQQEFLAAIGCDEAQGYLFSRPVPIDKVSELLGKSTEAKVVAA
jgi:diguanylate cyclase (GGDEF)-like protein